MSMTVHITLQGMTELSLLMEALRQMGKSATELTDSAQKVGGKTVLAIANINGSRVGFRRNKTGELEMVGDSDWHCMKDKKLRDKILQQYSVAAVTRKAKELNYSVASIETLEDGSIRLLARAWG